MAIERTTSAGLWRFARDYANAAAHVANATEHDFSDPMYFLYGRSIELSLKAFLVARGTPYSKLRFPPYSHNLNNLLKEARRRRLGTICKLAPREIEVIEVLNEQYSSKRHEYIVTGTFHTPGQIGLHLTANKLVRMLEKYCVNATYPGLRT